jgi:polysaccharide biosynthesis protein PelD
MLARALRNRWTESIAISLLVPAIGYVIDPSDPFFINYRFPWLILAPMLAGLRYGFVCGITSAALLVSMITGGFYLGLPTISFFPEEMLIGLLLITLISTEFRESSLRQIRRLEHKYNHLKIRMDTFARSYQLIKDSHYRLEQHLAGQAKSLRLSLDDLKKKIFTLENQKGEPLQGIGDSILRILGSYANVQMAGIYAVNEQCKMNPNPVASLGQARTLLSSDPVIAEALKTGHVASIEMEKNGSMRPVGALVAIPLIDVYERIWGVIVVNEMPLFAFQENTMDFLAVLGGKIGDLIKRRAEGHGDDRDIGRVFESRLRRITSEIQHLKTSAVAIAVIVNSEEPQNELLEKFHAELRGVDEILIMNDNWGRRVFLLLLPYTDDHGANELLQRVGLSKSTAEMAFDDPTGTAFQFRGGNISVCMWILDDKTAFEKVLLNVDRFCKNEFIDINVNVLANPNAGVSNFA